MAPPDQDAALIARVVVNGVDWWQDCIDRWHSAGARRFIDYRQLAAELSHRLEIDTREGGIRLTVSQVSTLPLVKPLDVHVRCPAGDHLPEVITVCVGDSKLPVHRVEDGVGRVVLGH